MPPDASAADGGGMIECEADAGELPCDDREPLRIDDDRDAKRGSYSSTCDAQPLDSSDGCRGLPDDVWNPCKLKQCAARSIYPLDCSVYLPTPSPVFEGFAQECFCRKVSGDKFQWVCPM